MVRAKQWRLPTQKRAFTGVRRLAPKPPLIHSQTAPSKVSFVASRNKRAVLCALLAFSGAQAPAAPPAPPAPETLAVVQSFIKASVDKNLSLYTSLLSDDFVGVDAEVDKAMTRQDWLAGIAGAFQNRWLRTKVLEVFYGYHIVGEGLQYRVMIVERLDNYPDPPHSDCCTFYRTEVLVLNGNRVSKIGRSIPFVDRLSNTGSRTDIPN
jgi:hypothetical protein